MVKYPEWFTRSAKEVGKNDHGMIVLYLHPKYEGERATARHNKDSTLFVAAPVVKTEHYLQKDHHFYTASFVALKPGIWLVMIGPVMVGIDVKGGKIHELWNTIDPQAR